MGCLDNDGFLTLKDRSKDLIISGGSNIYPREVEEVLLTAPGVAEVAVVGASDPEWGEVVVAFVVVAVIMIFVIPAFKEVFSNFGGELPLQAPQTLSAGRQPAQKQLRQGTQDRSARATPANRCGIM